MSLPRAFVIVAPDVDAARDQALDETKPGDHLFFVLADGTAAEELAESFRYRDPLAASSSLEAGALSVVTSAILAHGGIDCLIVVVRPDARALHECEPADVLGTAIALPWELLRAAAPFLRERKGTVRFTVDGTHTMATFVRSSLEALARGWSASTGLDAQLTG